MADGVHKEENDMLFDHLLKEWKDAGDRVAVRVDSEGRVRRRRVTQSADGKGVVWAELAEGPAGRWGLPGVLMMSREDLYATDWRWEDDSPEQLEQETGAAKTPWTEETLWDAYRAGRVGLIGPMHQLDVQSTAHVQVTVRPPDDRPTGSTTLTVNDKDWFWRDGVYDGFGMRLGGMPYGGCRECMTVREASQDDRYYKLLCARCGGGKTIRDDFDAVLKRDREGSWLEDDLCLQCQARVEELS